MTVLEAKVLDRVRKNMNRDYDFNRRLSKSADLLNREAGYRVCMSVRDHRRRLKPLFDIASKTLRTK